MRFSKGSLPLSVAVLYVLSTTAALAAPELGHVSGADELAADALAQTNKATVGRKDAPVDGKDGRPHEGPWIETEAERTRKKSTKDSSADDTQSADKTTGKDSSAVYPESNDGVMDDRNRAGPKEGTRGTEGGISEKSREKQETLESVEKKPEAPKEVPSLPHAEEEKIPPVKEAKPKTSDEDEDKTKPTKQKDEEEGLGEVGGLKKPELPEKPHDIPHPVPVGSSEKDPLEIKTPSADSSIPAESTTLIQPLHSFFLAFTMILFSEVGDKTFLVAALMAMKHPPFLVFTAAFSALFVMTILSAVLGHAVPALLSVRVTNFLAAILFLIFGGKMLKEGHEMSPEQGVGEEMREVEMELEEKEQMARRMRRQSDLPSYMLEGGRGSRKSRSSSRLPAPPDSPPSSPDSRSPSPSRVSSVKNALSGINNLCSFLLSPAWVQTFVMTFLGEWGDRSQIATIAMSAGQDYWFVAMGSLAGHSICTAAAVIGGRAIAGRVSLRVGKCSFLGAGLFANLVIVTLGGAFAFLVFGFIYLAEAFYYK